VRLHTEPSGSSATRASIEVLVCTYEERILDLANRLPAPSPGVAYLITHQTPSRRLYRVESLRSRADVRVIRFSDSGLSRNRNHCLRYASGRLCLVADDDIEFLPGWHEALANGFAEHPKASFITFALLGEGDRLKRDYPTEPTPHTVRSAFRVVSSEIAFDLDRVRALRVGFNEHLGIGTPVGLGEENVFLRDLMMKGATGCFVPATLVRNGPDTTGERIMANLGSQQVFSIGAMAYCRRGGVSHLLSGKEAVRLAMRRGRVASIPGFLMAFNQGVMHARRLGFDQVSRLGPG